MKVLLIFLLSLFVKINDCQVTFTGNATYDFSSVALSPQADATKVIIPCPGIVAPSPYMAAHNRTTGWQLHDLDFQYDYLTDTLYVATNSFGITGDCDGDGNPSHSSDPAATDFANLDYSETVSVMIWTNVPSNYVPGVGPNADAWTNFLPNFVFGVNAISPFGLETFGGYTITLSDCSTSSDVQSCDLANIGILLTIGQNYGIQYSILNSDVIPPTYFVSPSFQQQALEFTIYNFSLYYNPPFTPGIDPVTFAVAANLGSAADSVGEETQPPGIFTIPCTIYDACGVCGGHNQSMDACGVCFGDNSTCADCAGVPNGGETYDACGVCGGNNKSKDACGVCFGNNSTCADCAGVPNGPEKYDACGVCGGNNKTCEDCAGVPNGKEVYDRCGVCGGDSSTCECFFDSTLTFLAEDTWIEITNREANHGDDGRLSVSWNRSRTLVQFYGVRYSILENSNGNPQILGATIRLFIGFVGCSWNDPDLAIHLLNTSFEQNEATWVCSKFDDAGSCDYWRMIGLQPEVQVDYNPVPSGIIPLKPGQLGWIEFDVLNDLVNFMEGPYYTELSYMVKKLCEQSPGCASFWSCDGGQCPELVVNLRTECPTTPATPTPTPPCSTNPVNVWNWDS